MISSFSIVKIITALLLGYACAAAWVVYADVVYHNNVPLEDFIFHGLYPVSLGISAIIAVLLFDHNLKSLGFKKFRPPFILIPFIITFVVLLIPFGFNLLTGMVTINASPKFDMDLVTIGIPVLMFLSMGEEIMWRGILFSELSKKFNYTETSLIIGLCWTLWHYPIIIHTKFVYADRPLWFVLISFTILVFSFSFIYNYIRTKTGSIWLCIFSHALQNYVGFVLIEPLEFSSSANAWYFKNDIGIFYILITACAALWCIYKMKNIPTKPVL